MTETVSVIILNWNGKRYIEACIESVLSQDYPKVEVIVVDNGSQDGSLEVIKEHYKDVRLIETGNNLGFGGGNNIGIQYAQGAFIAVLNNDAFMESSCIKEMVEAIQKKDYYGACASKIFFADEKNVIDAAGIVVFPDGLSIGRGRLESGSLYDQEEEVFFASGCCALYRREMLKDIMVSGEYYDEDFFAYADDTDLGWRAQLRGWKCIYAPKALVYHAHSASSSRYSPLKAYLVERNRMWLALKSFPYVLIGYGLLCSMKRYAYQAYGVFSGKGASGEFVAERSKTELVKILLNAYASTITGVTRMLKKRKIIRAGKKIGTREMLEILKVYGITAQEIALQG